MLPCERAGTGASLRTVAAACPTPASGTRRIMLGMASDLLVGLAGGAIGSLLIYVGRVSAVPAEVARHDRQARALLEDLERWVWDEHRKLRQELDGITNTLAAQGQLHSGAHGAARAEAKTQALQRYRDRRSLKDRAFADLVAAEGWPHDLWRLVRRINPIDYNIGFDGSTVIDEWRKPVTRHGGEPIPVFDPSKANVVEELIGDLFTHPLESPVAEA